MIKLKLLSVDAWREPEGWYWNDVRLWRDDILFDEDQLTPRKVTAFLRRNGFLGKRSVRIDMHPEIVDGYLIEILDKSTRRPFLALSTIH